ncbi:MAG: cystathionine gamma-synthase [Alteromonadaceae bacterium]|jgi:cystathionine gamma-synthase
MTNFATAAVRSGIETDTQFGAITPPIYLTSNYSFAGFGQPRQYDYARSGNPTRSGLEVALAELEHGVGTTVTASGMAAVSLPLQLLKPDDLLIAPHDCYGGSYRLFSSLAKRGQFKILFVDQTDDAALAEALSQNPAMLWIESPSNPLLRVVDIAKLASLAQAVDCLTVVDNTFLSPAQQQPLDLGADIVVHSTTKYINGHSDVVGGAVISKTEQLATDIAWWGNCLGITGSPFDSFLTLRGLRTLPVRIRQHQENTSALVAHLDGHPAIKRVYYPGLKSHPTHEIAKKQQQGFGAIVSFELNLDYCDIARFLEGLELFSLAESLGGVESLICHPATMTHAAMDEAARATAGITGSLIRVSVGIELVDDLLADFEQAVGASKLVDKVDNNKERDYEPC